MSIKNKKKEFVSKKVNNEFAYMIEYALQCILPSGEFLKENVSENTYQKYCSFIDALNKDAGHIQCDELVKECIIEYGFNYK